MTTNGGLVSFFSGYFSYTDVYKACVFGQNRAFSCALKMHCAADRTFFPNEVGSKVPKCAIERIRFHAINGPGELSGFRCIEFHESQSYLLKCVSFYSTWALFFFWYCFNVNCLAILWVNSLAEVICDSNLQIQGVSNYCSLFQVRVQMRGRRIGHQWHSRTVSSISLYLVLQFTSCLSNQIIEFRIKIHLLMKGDGINFLTKK